MATEPDTMTQLVARVEGLEAALRDLCVNMASILGDIDTGLRAICTGVCTQRLGILDDKGNVVAALTASDDGAKLVLADKSGKAVACLSSTGGVGRLELLGGETSYAFGPAPKTGETATP